MRDPQTSRPLRALCWFDNGVEWIEQTALVTGVAMMAAINIINVLSRNVLGESLTFAEEANQALIVLITFMGIGYGVRRARHIRMSAFYDQLRGRTRKALMCVICAGTAALLFLLAGYAVDHVVSLYGLGSVTPALRVPLFAIQMVVPLGLALGGIQYLLALLRNLTTTGVWLSFTEPDQYVDP